MKYLLFLLFLVGCAGGSGNPKPVQLWPDGLYSVTIQDSTAYFTIEGPWVAVNGTEVETEMKRYFTRGRPSRWEQVGSRQGVEFGLRAKLQVRFTYNGRSVVVTARRMASNG